MICRSAPRCREVAAAVLRKAKNFAASSGQAATHSASIVRQASRTQEKR
jgi:hypothetical protein